MSSPLPRNDTDFARLPLYFIANRGQTDRQVAFYVEGRDKSLYFTSEGITVALMKPSGPAVFTPGCSSGEPERWVVKLDFLDSNRDVRPIGEAKTGSLVSYFRGKPEEWRTGLATFSRIVYPGLWPGVDLVYSGTVNRLKYEFIVHPGADPSRIRLAYRGAESVSVDGNGRLLVKTPAGLFSDDAPLAYQEKEGKRIPVGLNYRLGGETSVNKVSAGRSGRAGVEDADAAQPGKSHPYGFEVGAYDRNLPLILDPAILVYCGYVGGSGDDSGRGIAVDAGGNVYITGTVASTGAAFPVTAGPDLTYNGGGTDAFVAKLNSSGTAFSYCGFIGGSSDDYGIAIAVDGAGNAYISGYTSSPGTSFPVTAGPDLTYNGLADAFIAKVNPSGTVLSYCGYIGGTTDDFGGGIAVDSAGNAYVTGTASSSEATFPVAAGPDLTHNGGTYDAFVAKVNSSGTALSYCGYIGGAALDYGVGMAADSAGSAYVTGNTVSTEASFPVAAGPDLTYNGGTYDVFVAKVNSSGAGLSYCGYIGGSSSEFGQGIAVDSAANAYITGYTASLETSFPVAGGPDPTYNGGGRDAFIAKVNFTGTALSYCGYVGGSGSDYGQGIAVDSAGNAYVTGYTSSTEATFPSAEGPDLTFNGGSYDAFMAKVNSSGTALSYCGFIGGSTDDYGYAVAVDSAGNAYVTGQTNSTQTTFPVTGGPDPTFNAGIDAFVARISYLDIWSPRHAAGDFDGDGADEVAVDFGANGAWIYDGGAWTILTAGNPKSLLAADLNGDGIDEILLDFGSAGLWVVVGGVGHGISTKNAEVMASGDVDGDGTAELVCDFGFDGLWLFDGDVWTQISGVNADYLITADLVGAGTYVIIGDFGPVGLWMWNGGVWIQLSGVNAECLAAGRSVTGNWLAGDFGAIGLWMWSAGSWTQLSGVNADYLIAADADADGDDEVVGDFAATGLWSWDSGAWAQLSGANADFMIRADVNGDGKEATAVDFGSIGLWLWNAGAWTQLSNVNPEYLMAADLDADNKDEIIVDFGALGLWLWDEGTWNQISAINPD